MIHFPGLYILDGHEPRPVENFQDWAIWCGTNDRHVALTEIPGAAVSTIFLGLNHRFIDDGPPLLFETMCFSDTGEPTGPQRRYSTWDEAEAGHAEICEEMRARLVHQ